MSESHLNFNTTPTYNVSSYENSTESTLFTTTASVISKNFTIHHELKYLLFPLGSLLIIVLLTGMVILFLNRKRRIDRLRHHLVPYYNFPPGEEDEWETELLESEKEIPARRDYNSVPLYTKQD